MFCLCIWPPAHRVFDDEFTFISQSVNIVTYGKAGILLKGSRLEPEILGSWTESPKLPGFAWLEAVVLFLTKNFEYSCFILNIVLGALSVGVAYRIAWTLTGSEAIAWWSSFFLASLPAFISYSMSGASDIAGLFFFLLFLHFIIEYRFLTARALLYAALFCGLYSICIKPLYGAFVVCGFIMALYIYRRAGLLDGEQLPGILLNTFCLFLPMVWVVPVFLSCDSMAGFHWALSYLFGNLCTTISYLLDYKHNSLVTVLVAMAAVMQSIFYKKDNLVILFAGWFLIALFILSLFSAGGISYSSGVYSDRYFLFLAFPVVFLAAKGVPGLVSRSGVPFLGMLIFVLLAGNAVYASNNLNEEAKNNFFYRKILLWKQVFPYVPQGAYILDECAATVSAISPHKAIQTEMFLKGDQPRRVVFLQGIPGDLYNPEDPKRMASVRNIFNNKYLCEPLVSRPIQEASLFAMPLLCAHKFEHHR